MSQCPSGLDVQSFLLCHKAREDSITWTFRLFSGQDSWAFICILSSPASMLFTVWKFAQNSSLSPSPRLINQGSQGLWSSILFVPPGLGDRASNAQWFHAQEASRIIDQLADRLWDMQCLWWSALYNHMRQIAYIMLIRVESSGGASAEFRLPAWGKDIAKRLAKAFMFLLYEANLFVLLWLLEWKWSSTSL